MIAGGFVLVSIYMLTYGCAYMSVATHESLNIVGIESTYATVHVNGTDHSHAYLLISGEPFEPFEPLTFGLIQNPNFDYDNPRLTYNATSEFIANCPNWGRIPQNIGSLGISNPISTHLTHHHNPNRTHTASPIGAVSRACPGSHTRRP